MKKILTKKEKWAYTHWSLMPAFFWLISPYFWIAFFITGLIASLSFVPCIDLFHSYIMPQVYAVWYGRAIAYLCTVVYAIICIATGFGLVYYSARIWLFFFDKDEFYQKFYKRNCICHNFICWGCKKEDCPARTERT